VAQHEAFAHAVAGHGQVGRQQAVHDRLDDQRATHDGIGPVGIQARQARPRSSR
jgi:hypothetical protein